MYSEKKTALLKSFKIRTKVTHLYIYRLFPNPMLYKCRQITSQMAVCQMLVITAEIQLQITQTLPGVLQQIQMWRGNHVTFLSALVSAPDYLDTPWCFTQTLPDVEREPCDIPKCSSKCSRLLRHSLMFYNRSRCGEGTM